MKTFGQIRSIEKLAPCALTMKWMKSGTVSTMAPWFCSSVFQGDILHAYELITLSYQISKMFHWISMWGNIKLWTCRNTAVKCLCTPCWRQVPIDAPNSGGPVQPVTCNLFCSCGVDCKIGWLVLFLSFCLIEENTLKLVCSPLLQKLWGVQEERWVSHFNPLGTIWMCMVLCLPG